jgi:P-type E1-E2 ATPase
MVGDLVEVETGEILSVDGLIIRGTEVMADESAITGESIEIRKKPFTEKEHNNPFLVSGSKVVDGNCTIFVLAVGNNSQDGKLKSKIQQDQGETPLQHKLEKLAKQIGAVGVTCAVVTFIAMCANYTWMAFRSGNFKETMLSMKTVQQLISNFIVGVSIIVMSVP